MDLLLAVIHHKVDQTHKNDLVQGGFEGDELTKSVLSPNKFSFPYGVFRGKMANLDEAQETWQ